MQRICPHSKQEHFALGPRSHQLKITSIDLLVAVASVIVSRPDEKIGEDPVDDSECDIGSSPESQDQISALLMLLEDCFESAVKASSLTCTAVPPIFAAVR
jgi:hypothetical protein